jgi:hypothetical protein
LPRGCMPGEGGSTPLIVELERVLGEQADPVSFEQMDLLQAGAIFDLTAAYRYSLWRVWSANSPRVAFIMLNPSRADAQHNDPTIRRCMNFAYRWGFGSMEVVNLFAYRSPDPAQLRRVDDPVGSQNHIFLAKALRRATRAIAAWGTWGTLLDRDRALLGLLGHADALSCLGLTKEGHPRHPLYVRSTARPLAYPGALPGFGRDKTKKLNNSCK